MTDPYTFLFVFPLSVGSELRERQRAEQRAQWWLLLSAQSNSDRPAGKTRHDHQVKTRGETPPTIYQS